MERQAVGRRLGMAMPLVRNSQADGNYAISVPLHSEMHQKGRVLSTDMKHPEPLRPMTRWKKCSQQPRLGRD